MSQKRQSEEVEEKADADGSGEKKHKGGAAAFRCVVMDALKMNAIQNFVSALEPLLRTVVKEEVELALAKNLLSMKRQCGKQIYPSSSRSLQLQFQTMLSLPIFTGSKIEGEDSSVICVALVDALTGDVVTSGPESLLKVEIVVLEGDFEGDEKDNWTFEEFKSNIVKEREGKRTLLSGDAFLSLNNGTGVVSELAFTDNSSWTRSRKFRLGARVENGYFNGTRIKEAKTEPFVVKDHRGELYKKHYPPSLDDEVWRLEKIGKDGAFHRRLTKEKIKTVKDFLTLLSIDTTRLRNILGNGMSTKMWEVTVDHARTCTLCNQLYVYYQDSLQKTGVVFNDVWELKGIFSEQQYIHVADLSDIQKAEAQKLVKIAYDHQADIRPIESAAITGDSGHVPSNSIPSGSPFLGGDFYECSSSQKLDMLGYPRPIATPDIVSSILSLDMDSAYNTSFMCHEAYKPSLFFDSESSSQMLFDSQLLDSEILQSQKHHAGSPTDLASAVSEFLPAHRKMKKNWRKLLSVFRFTIFLFLKRDSEKREQG